MEQLKAALVVRLLFGDTWEYMDELSFERDIVTMSMTKNHR